MISNPSQMVVVHAPLSDCHRTICNQILECELEDRVIEQVCGYVKCCFFHSDILYDTFRPDTLGTGSVW